MRTRSPSTVIRAAAGRPGRRGDGDVTSAATDARRIDEILRHWRQGDCVLGRQWFLFRLDVEAPLTVEAAEAAQEGADAAEMEILGLAVVTQTCDIVRECTKRPFVEVCPLVEVDSRRMKEIERSRSPRYAFIPGVAGRNLVADLERVMTVEKAVVARWERTAGCRNDQERRRLSLALVRKRSRTAFPDDFVDMVRPLTDRLASKHGKKSEEGRALRALREIRVRAAPSWQAEDVEILFLFIRAEDEPDFEAADWHEHLDAWLKLVQPQGRFVSVDGLVQTLDDLTARDYVESDALDLDHLSE